jgi:hypothetical protein
MSGLPPGRDPRSAGRRRALLQTLPLLVVAVIGLGLSTWASYTQFCALTCGPWFFDPWWGFWTSLAAFLLSTAAAVLAARSERRRRLVAVAAIAAAVCVAPLPVELWRENELRRVLEGLL